MQIQRIITIGFIFAFVALGTVIGLTYLNNKSVADSSKWLWQTNQVLYQTEEIVSLSSDIGVGVRGYLLTEDEGFLAQSKHARAVIFLKIDSIKGKVHSQAEKAQLDTLRILVEKRIASADKIFLLLKNGNNREYENYIASGAPQEITKQIRAMANRIAASENALLTRRQRDITTKQRMFYITFFLLAVGILAVLGLVYYLMIYHLNARNKAEKKLRESEHLLNAIIDNTSLSIIVKDLKNRYQLVNRHAASLFNMRPEQMMGKTLFDFFPADVAERVNTGDNDVIKFHKVIETEEQITVFGKVSTYISVKFPLYDENGDIIGLCIISTDITERKNSEEEIRALNNELNEKLAKLEEANRELNAFTYSASHDLRAPLRAISGFTTLLRRDYSQNLDSEAVRMLDVLGRNAHKMSKLIDDLLTYSRIGRAAMNISEVEINNFALGIINELQDAYQRKIDVTFGENRTVNCDKNLMRTVLTSLFDNAIKYSANQPRPQIHFGSYRQQNGTVFYVKDNGVGFDMQFSNKLFNVFQRLHSDGDFEGAGVGLAIVHRIVEKHNGKVWAEGKVNEGATFYFSIPDINFNGYGLN